MDCRIATPLEARQIVRRTIMATALEYFRSIAAVLGDDEPNRPFQRYSLHDMVMAYNRGLAVVYSYRPDLFTFIKKVKLEPGSRQNATGCCDNVLSILEQVDENGNVIEPLATTKSARPKAPTKSSWVHKKSCLIHTDKDGEAISYVIDYAALDNQLNGQFSVHPPVPCGVDAWVNVKCVQPPCDFAEQNVNGQLNQSSLHNTALWHYVLSSMLSGDRHAAGATTESTHHFNIFLKLLDIEMRQEVIAEAEGAIRGV